MTLDSLTKTTTTPTHILKLIINMVSIKWMLSDYHFRPIYDFLVLGKFDTVIFWADMEKQTSPDELQTKNIRHEI